MKFLLILFISISLSAQLDAQTYLDIPALSDSVNLDRLKGTIDSLTWAGGYQNRVAYSAGSYYSAGYLARSFAALPGISTVQLDTFYYTPAQDPYSHYPLINVVATMEGSSTETIIIGAHYDASGNRENEQDWLNNWSTLKVQGADDNASGVAAVIEIARVLSDPAQQLDNQSTLQFIAFAAEETHPMTDSHHLGSLYDAYWHSQRGTNIKAVLVLDMIAYNSIMDYMEIISDPASVWLADSIRQLAMIYLPDLTVNSAPYPNVTYSDHQSYWNYGFPAILLMENDSPWNNDLPYYSNNPYYHKVSDLAATLNFSLLHKTTKLALTALAALAYNSTPSGWPVEKTAERRSQVVPISILPNPFNSTANIKFSLRQGTPVNFDVYDISGGKVETVIKNLYFTSGSHTIQWQPAGLASGVYIGILDAAGFRQSVKLVLLK